MMTARECFKLAYGATRLAWNADTRIGNRPTSDYPGR